MLDYTVYITVKYHGHELDTFENVEAKNTKDAKQEALGFAKNGLMFCTNGSNFNEETRKFEVEVMVECAQGYTFEVLEEVTAKDDAEARGKALSKVQKHIKLKVYKVEEDGLEA